MMEESPELFSGLTQAQRDKLPTDLWIFGRRMSDDHVKFYFPEYVETGTTREEVERILPKGRHAAWNEGRPKEEETARFLDITDGSIVSLFLFLEKIKAFSVKETLDGLARARKIFLAKRAASSNEGIAVGATRDAKARADDILYQLLVSAGVSRHVRRLCARAFSIFYAAKDQGSFSLDSAFPVLVPFVREFESEESANEGLIRLREYAYSRILFEADEEEGPYTFSETMHEIEKTFLGLARYYAKKHNRMVDAREIKGSKVSEADMPPKDGSVIFEGFSRSLLPTAKIKRDGTLRVNLHYAKVMHMLKKRGLAGEAGTIYDLSSDGELNRSKRMGNLFESINYAVAIHEINGHFPINVYGYPEYTPDEAYAQGKRGDGHLYVNLLSTLFYWLIIVENTSIATAARAESFMKQYPEIFEGLENEERQKLPRHLEELFHDLLKKGALPTDYFFDPLLRRRTEMDWKDYESIILSQHAENETSPDEDGLAGRFDASFKPLDLFNFFYFEEFPLTEKEIISLWPTIDSSDVTASLSVLKEMEVLNVLRPDEEDPYSEERYEMDQRVRSKYLKILDMLIARKLGNFNNADAVKAEVLEIIEPWWANAFLTSLEIFAETLSGKKDQDAKDKVLMAVEADWVPGDQKDDVQKVLQAAGKALGKEGVELIRKSKGESAEEFAARVMAKYKEENIPVENIVVVASKDTVNLPLFSEIRAVSPEDKNKAFFAGIDPRLLGKDSYIGMLEILTMVMRMASGKKLLTNHPLIEIGENLGRTVFLIPQARKVDIRKVPQVYKAQVKVLLSL
jgi:hypothetical protein